MKHAGLAFVLLFLFQFISGVISAQGKLMIIGGGSRPPQLIQRMIEESGVKQSGYVLILPMASEEQDSAIWYARRQFVAQGLTVAGMQVMAGDRPSVQRLDSIRSARLIYLTGGDQQRFMNIVQHTGIVEALHSAYERGALIAGTSAGAAVMSKQMITGNEKRYPEYQSTFPRIEADNIQFSEGLGLITDAVIDQHFVQRSRYNRLLTAVLEYPEMLGIGIDESTAILVSKQNVEVVGDAQVVVFINPSRKTNRVKDKLGAHDLRVSIYLPGEKFSLKRK